MKLPALIAAPLAWIYGLIINVRHKLFDLKILRSEEFDIPVVCVGNLTVGGTGKTPVTEFLIERLSGERPYFLAGIAAGPKGSCSLLRARRLRA